VIRQLALLVLRRDAGPERIAAFEAAAEAAARESAALRMHLARHLPGALGGGHYSLEALFESARDLGSAGACPLPAPSLEPYFDPANPRCVVASSDVVCFAPQHLGLPAPEIGPCIKRTLLLRTRPQATPEAVARFERDLLAMPRQIASIRNWALSRPDPALQPTRWTHVWEQEYEELSGLQRDYMSHPWHWGRVDGWFDPECPQRIAELELVHVFYRAPGTILGWAASPAPAPGPAGAEAGTAGAAAQRAPSASRTPRSA
jgi:hypothetical protein